MFKGLQEICSSMLWSSRSTSVIKFIFGPVPLNGSIAKRDRYKCITSHPAPADTSDVSRTYVGFQGQQFIPCRIHRESHNKIDSNQLPKMEAGYSAMRKKVCGQQTLNSKTAPPVSDRNSISGEGMVIMILEQWTGRLIVEL